MMMARAGLTRESGCVAAAADLRDAVGFGASTIAALARGFGVSATRACTRIVSGVSDLSTRVSDPVRARPRRPDLGRASRASAAVTRCSRSRTRTGTSRSPTPPVRGDAAGARPVGVRRTPRTAPQPHLRPRAAARLGGLGEPDLTDAGRRCAARSTASHAGARGRLPARPGRDGDLGPRPGGAPHHAHQLADGGEQLITTHTLRVPGATLHHELRGTGPVLLLLLGAGGDAAGPRPARGRPGRHVHGATHDPRGLLAQHARRPGTPSKAGTGPRVDDAPPPPRSLVSRREPALRAGSASSGRYHRHPRAAGPGTGSGCAWRWRTSTPSSARRTRGRAAGVLQCGAQRRSSARARKRPASGSCADSARSCCRARHGRSRPRPGPCAGDDQDGGERPGWRAQSHELTAASPRTSPDL